MNLPIFKLWRCLSTRFLAALGAGALLAGCGPVDWLFWAPDGRHAIIQYVSSPALIDPSGRILRKLESGPDENVKAWMPDSRRVLINRSARPANWAEYAGLMEPERVEAIRQSATVLADLIKNYQGDLHKFGNSPGVQAWNTSLQASGEELLNVVYYLDQLSPGLLDPLIEADKQNTEAAAKRDNAGVPSDGNADDTGIHAESRVPFIIELHLRDVLAADAPADELLVRSVDAIAWAAPSPNGRAIAYVRSEPEDGRLYVRQVSPGAKPFLVDTGTSYAAWSADSQVLAYAKTSVRRGTSSSITCLGTITRRTVATPAGNLIAEPEAPEDLAGVILSESTTHVAWLPDGRLLFPSASISLPATSQSMPSEITLFALRLEPQIAVQSLVPETLRPQLPERGDRFVLSPDGAKVAILGKKGEVAVFFLQSGDLRRMPGVLPKAPDSESLYTTLPSWKNAEELCYVVGAGDPDGSPNRSEMVVARLDGPKRALSLSWPGADVLPALKAP